ncbi:hypothetical protein SO802_009760 [Lithocarpus litseifolius]|uniref:Aminotransferase-like plant mobile domain-containing protein n=1 Tax=Lithocarpus litseifolius TaxID=425828 RepID=A0AAW2DF91_9ROSI
MLLPQKTTEEHVRMVRVFLLHLLGLYLFGNGGQLVSLRWLTLFQDFAEARRANWGQACLAYLYSTLDTFSRGTLRLTGLHGPANPFLLLWTWNLPLSLLRRLPGPLKERA